MVIRLGMMQHTITGWLPPLYYVHSIRLDMTPQQRKKIPPLCPDFVIELCSETDSKEKLRKKMEEYLTNGIRLGWLIDPKTQEVEIYRQGQAVEILQCPKTLSGEGVLPGFVLELEPIFGLG